MAIMNDEMKEDLDYSSLLDSLNNNFSEEAPSLEDVAWADSCLNKDVDSSNADWSSVKDALLEILISRQGPPSLSVAESSGQPTDNEIRYFRDNVTSQDLVMESYLEEDLVYDDDVRKLKILDLLEDTEEEEDDDDDVDVLRNKHGRVKGKGRNMNVFRPNYREESVTSEKLDSNMDLGSTSYGIEPSTEEDIFKVWDLEVSDELDDFTKQLNKALTDFPQQSRATDVDSILSEGFANVSIDDLIAGVSGLSLMQNSE